MGWSRNAFLLTAPLVSAGCNAAFWGNIGVLGLTVAIFLGTVFLTRQGHGSGRSGRSAVSSTASTVRMDLLPLTGSGRKSVEAGADRQPRGGTPGRAPMRASGRS